jgi:flagellar biosynthesis/type III secretory pathway protein FliH
MNSPALAEKGRILGGPWHPAFGFLVRARMFRKAVEGSLPGHGKARHIHLRVNAREIPLIHGDKNEGIRWILDKTGTERVTVEPDDTLPMGEVQVTAA